MQKMTMPRLAIWFFGFVEEVHVSAVLGKAPIFGLVTRNDRLLSELPRDELWRLCAGGPGGGRFDKSFEVSR
jgi:hypothetical protein